MVKEMGGAYITTREELQDFFKNSTSKIQEKTQEFIPTLNFHSILL